MCDNGGIQGDGIKDDFLSYLGVAVVSLCNELATCFMSACLTHKLHRQDRSHVYLSTFVCPDSSTGFDTKKMPNKYVN
jgi:hypothetical protein